MCTRLHKIEKRILEIMKLLSRDSTERGLSGRGIARHFVEDEMKAEDEPLIKENEQLEKERQFIIDRRENIFWRMTWLIFGAFLAVGAQYLVKKIGLS